LNSGRDELRVAVDDVLDRPWLTVQRRATEIMLLSLTVAMTPWRRAAEILFL